MRVRVLAAASLLTFLLLNGQAQAEFAVWAPSFTGSLSGIGSITYASPGAPEPIRFDLAGDGSYTEADSYTWHSSVWDGSNNLIGFKVTLNDTAGTATGVDVNVLTNGTWNAVGGTANGAYTLAPVIPAIIVDDFDDGDAAGWTESDTPAVTESYTAASGAYRMTAAPTGNPFNPPRAGSNRFEDTATHTDFALRVDITDFDETRADQSFGLFARQQQIGPGTTNGIALAYVHGFNQLILNVVQSEVAVLTLDASTTVTLDPLEDYRLVFEGTGDRFSGTLYELPNLETPVAKVVADHALYNSGRPGLFAFDNGGLGASGVDVTFDDVVFGGPSTDQDGDGLSDLQEIAHSTDLLDADSDNDGISDEDELRVFAFVTSTNSTGNKGGLAGADATCNSLAEAAGLGTGYRAWLSDSTADARDRIEDRVYQRVDGTVIASSLARLTDSMGAGLLASISLDESGVDQLGASVVTSTHYSGVGLGLLNNSTDHCSDWTASSIGIVADGLANSATTDWTVAGMATSCTLSLPHYCFGTNSSDPNNADSDGDGLCDGGVTGASGEGTLANCPNGGEDTNGNGLYDVGVESDPNSADTDGDGLSDGDEVVVYGTDPLATDSDGDGWSDADETSRGTDPNDIAAFPSADSFDAEIVISNGQTSSPQGLAAADLDADGDLDVLVARFNDPPDPTLATGTFAWHENDGSPGLGTYRVLSDNGSGAPDGTAGGRAIAAADLNGDGFVDVIGAEQIGNRIVWYENNPGGVPGAGQFSTMQVVGGQSVPLSIAVGDWNGDGDIDLATGGFSTVKIWANDGVGSFVSTSHSGFALVYDLESADVDLDGDLDLVVADTNGNRLVVLENDAAGVFTEQSPALSSLSSTDTRRIDVGDIDGDGDPDVVRTAVSGGTIAWYENPHVGGGSTWTEHEITSPLGTTVGVVAHDFDLDGDVDLAVAGSGGAGGAAGVFYFENGGGAPSIFGPQQALVSSVNGASDMITVDLSTDGRDLVIGSDAGAVTAWFDGHFNTQVDWVDIGDPGNSPDVTGFGSVPSAYRIGRYEVTNAEYVAFLNATSRTPTDLFDPSMSTLGMLGGIDQFGVSPNLVYRAKNGLNNYPVNYVTIFDAMRYVNWLENGQPIGPPGPATTEDGAYTITTGGITTNSIVRNPGAEHLLPSEDEWYKAAHYDPISQSYFESTAGSPGPITCALPSALPEQANCGTVSLPTPVGAYTGTPSPYGTFDQGGNLEEWTEDIDGLDRRVRGGRLDSPASALGASASGSPFPSVQSSAFVGMRIVPEPGVEIGLLLGSLVLGILARDPKRTSRRV